jgi:hypothetical protein
MSFDDDKPFPNDEIFLIDPPARFSIRRTASRLNRSERIGGAIIQALLILFFLGIAAPFLFLVGPLLVDGIWSKGTVISRDPLAWRRSQALPVASILAHGGGGKSTNYKIVYDFADAAGVKRRGSSSVSFSTWRDLRPGNAVDILYSESDPDHNLLWNGIQGNHVVSTIMGMVGLFLLASAGFRAMSGLFSALLGNAE